MFDQETFGKRLTQLRKSRSITQATLAERIGLSKALVNAWEKGNRKPDAEQVWILCEALGVNPNALFELFNTEGSVIEWRTTVHPDVPPTIMDEQTKCRDIFKMIMEQGVSAQEVRQQFNLTLNALNKYLIRGFRSGVIELVSVPRNEQLSQELAQKYRRNFQVVEVNPNLPSAVKNEAMATVIAHHILLTPHEYIIGTGIGAGEALLRAAEKTSPSSSVGRKFVVAVFLNEDDRRSASENAHILGTKLQFNELIIPSEPSVGNPMMRQPFELDEVLLDVNHLVSQRASSLLAEFVRQEDGGYFLYLVGTGGEHAELLRTLMNERAANYFVIDTELATNLLQMD